MEEKRQILFLHKIEQFDNYSNLNKNFYLNKHLKIIAYTLELRIYLKYKKIDYDIQENYLSKDDLQKMDNKAFYFSKNWHRNFFKFQGISLGLLIEYYNDLYFSRILRYVQLFLNIIKVYNPNEIITFTDNTKYLKEFEYTLKYICSLKNIPLNLIVKKEPSLSHTIKKKGIKKSLLKFFKRYVQDYFYIFLSKIFLHLKLIFYKKKKNILVNHIRYHKSIIKEISRNQNLFLLTNNVNKIKLIQNFKNIFNVKKGVYFLFSGTYKSIKINKQKNRAFKNLFIEWKKLFKNGDFQDFFIYKDISIWPIVKLKIYKYLIYDFKIFIQTILIQTKYLKSAKINAVIHGYDIMTNHMTLALNSSKLKIPSIVVQQGIVGGKLIFCHHGFIPCVSTKFATWGKISYQLLNSRGMESNKMVITGCPRLDIYVYLNKNKNLKKNIKNFVYKKFGIGKKKKLIVVALPYINEYNRFNSNPSISYNEKFINLSLTAIKYILDSHLIIKMHPGDNREKSLREIIKMLGINNFSIIKDYNITNLIAACDCFIVDESTTIIEALLLDKPVICLNFDEQDYTTPVFKYQVAFKATTSEELINRIKEVINEPVLQKNYSKFLEDYLFKIDGLSTKRVENLVYKLINKKN